MATASFTIINTLSLQPREQNFSRSLSCKFLSSHTHACPSLPSELCCPCIFVRPHVSVTNHAKYVTLSSLNKDFSTDTLEFRNFNENLTSGYSLHASNTKKTGRVVEEKEKVVDDAKNRKNGERLNYLGKKDDTNLSYNKRLGRKVEESEGKGAKCNDENASEEFESGSDGRNGGGSVTIGRRSGKESSSNSNSKSKAIGDRGRRRMEAILGSVEIENDGHSKRGMHNDSKGQKGSMQTSKKSNYANLANVIDGNVSGHSMKHINAYNNGNKGKNKKVESPEFRLRVGLDMCSKLGDVMGAISLYDSALRHGVKMGQHQYTVLLYLCSSAAMGVVRPAKSGSGSRSLEKVAPQDLDESDDYDEGEDEDDSDEEVDEDLGVKEQTERSEVNEIRVSDDVKKYALEKGSEIYERMCLDKVQMNEASLTSVARMAMAMGNGDLAFDMVKQMKSMGINPRLRSYGPALSVFTSSGDSDKAFAVEEHMLENGVYPEEPELEALLNVSVQAGKADRVYYVLQKLRTSVRSVTPSTAELIEKWFKSKEASRVGKRKWDHSMIAQIMENVGGGWHGHGWLGRGKWSVSRSSIGADGLCKCCGEKLALIDLDPEETEKFAESVARIATKREKNSSFQKFQRWLDYYGPFEAVVDAANVGLFSQRKFKPSKVNVVVNGIRQMLPSRKWPLIILHNRRVSGSQMDQPINRAVVERWKNADALYATPTGSNDDWYWLYAAIKFKCLLVTNDEMRDHTFQLLGNDFFPKWKERHQVRFSFSEIGPVFHMPPPCSVVIQESDRGSWHIPIASDHQSEGDRIWLCITRPKVLVMHQAEVGSDSGEDSEEDLEDDKKLRTLSSQSRDEADAPSRKQETEELISKGQRAARKKLSESKTSNSDHVPLRNAIKVAENRAGCTVDFQI